MESRVGVTPFRMLVESGREEPPVARRVLGGRLKTESPQASNAVSKNTEGLMSMAGDKRPLLKRWFKMRGMRRFWC